MQCPTAQSLLIYRVLLISWLQDQALAFMATSLLTNQLPPAPRSRGTIHSDPHQGHPSASQPLLTVVISNQYGYILPQRENINGCDLFYPD